jgi:hypothetical protein
MNIFRYARWRLSPAGRAAYRAYSDRAGSAAPTRSTRTRAQGPLRVTGNVARVAARQQAEDLANRSRSARTR